MKQEVRLQKFLAESGVASRRESEKLITAGKIRVNGKTIKELGTKVDPENDTIQIGNLKLQRVEKGVILFHKPRGVVSTLHDPEGRPCVGDFLTKRFRSYYPIGRLDWETTGLLILTNDGELAEHLAHPRYEFDRCYHVRVKGVPDARTLGKIEQGVKLRDGILRASVRVLKSERGNDAKRIDNNSTWLEIKVREGKNRVIRRLMEKLEYPVVKLRRVQHGPFKLGNLQPGEMRRLDTREYGRLKRIVMNVEKAKNHETEQPERRRRIR